jgi:E3 ubiquitin-protein ligase ZNF598
MSASITNTNANYTQQRSHRGGRGGSRGFRGHGRGGGPTQRKPQNNSTPAKSAETTDTPATPTEVTPTVEEPDTVAENTTATPQDDDSGICFICAEPVMYYSIAECNHRTCHVCALRLRALYKRNDCTFCKVHPCFVHKKEFELIMASTL